VRDFDDERAQRAARDRSFRIHGELFYVKPGVRPEVLVPYEDMSTETSATDALSTIDALVLGFISHDDPPGACDRWRAIRADEEDPLTMEDLTSLVEFLIETATGRPPTRASSSTASPETPRPGTSSTGDSASPVPIQRPSISAAS
jgi:hypothetical protein